MARERRRAFVIAASEEISAAATALPEFWSALHSAPAEDRAGERTAAAGGQDAGT